MEVLQAMDFIEEAFEDDGEPIRIRTLQKLASDDALLRTKIESKLQQEFTPVDLRARIAHAEMHACGTLPGSLIEDESFHEVLSVSFPTLQLLQSKSPLLTQSIFLILVHAGLHHPNSLPAVWAKL